MWDRLCNVIDRNTFDRTVASSPSSLCFLAFVAIMAVLKALGFYDGQKIFTLGLIAAGVFLLAKIVLTEHTLLEYAVIVLLLGMGVLVWRNSGDKSFLIILMVLVGMKGVPVRRVLQVFLAVWGACYILMIFLSLTGLNTELLLMHDKTGIGYVLCHSLGYPHSNVLHTNYLCISATVLVLAESHFTRRQKLALLGILAVLDVYIFLYSMSYTGLLGTAVLYVLYLYVTLRESPGTGERALSQMVLPVCLLFSLVGPLVIQGRLFDLINSALNTRYYLTRWFLTNQPITLFGTEFVIDNYRYNLDCSYAYALMYFGVVPFVILVALYLGTIHYMAKEGQWTRLAVTLGLCAAGVAEPFLFNLGFKNMSLFFVGEYLYEALARVQERLKGSGAAEGMCRHWSRSWADRIGRLALLQILWKLLQWGEGVCTGICHAGSVLLETWFRHGKRYLLLTLGCGLAAAAAAWAVTEPAEAVYIDSSINEEEESSREYITMTEEEAGQLKADGNYVYWFVDENEPMYIYTGTAAWMEYVRVIVSWGVWAAVIVSIIAAELSNHREKVYTDRVE